MKKIKMYPQICFLVFCLTGIMFSQRGYGHGFPGDTIGSEVKIYCDSQFVDIKVTLDLPIMIALGLRDKLDLNGDYKIYPEEHKRLLPLLYQAGDPVSLTIDGKKITLAPLYNPRLQLSRSPDFAGRGKLILSWFANTPEELSKGSKIEFTQQFWPQYKALVHTQLIGRDGYQFKANESIEKEYSAGQKRLFTFTTLAAGTKEAAEAQKNAPQKINIEDRMNPADAVLLAEAMVLNYSYLIPDDQRDRAKEVHRRLRMEMTKFPQSKNAEEKAGIMTRLDQAGAEFVELLKKCDKVTFINLEGNDKLKQLLEPVELPGDSGALLMRIGNGKGIHGGRVYNHSFKIYDHSIPLKAFVDPIDLGTMNKGTTWALVCLTEMPPDPTRIRFALQKEDGSAFYFPMLVKSPKPARLKVTILSDDTGKPAPAMMSLRWKTCNLDRRPPTALDVVAQFDGQGGQSNLRQVRLPGKRATACWVVTGPFEMNLPPGEWEVYIRRGVEHSSVSDTFSLKPGERLEKTYRPVRWIDMPTKGWYSGDDHVHSQILSDTDAENLLSYVEAEGVHLANVVKMGDIHRTFFQQRGFGKEFRVGNGYNFLSPGQECPRTHTQLGHTLAMNIQSMVRNTEKYYLYDTVFDEVHRQGGLSGYAHIDRDRFYVHRDMSMNLARGKVDFAEILQFGHLGTDLFYEFLNLGFPLTASAGSDLPWGGSIGEVRVYAYLGEQKFSVDKWFEAFGKGRTFVSNGPMLDLKVDGAYPGDTIELDRDRSVKVKASLLINPQLGAGKLELIAHGEVIKSVEGGGIGQSEISMEIDVPVKGGVWIALKGTGTDGSLAHTTPVYITRKGQRFWKRSEVENLIAKRLGNLEEIETIVAQAKKEVDEGAQPAKIEVHEMAKQGDQLLERVELAKDIYANLLKKHQKEARKP